MSKSDKELLKEIHSYCGHCSSSNDCPEDACILFRIESIIVEKLEREVNSKNEICKDKV